MRSSRNSGHSEARERIDFEKVKLMTNRVEITEKYERNGWPSVDRPDLRPPDGWSLDLINSLNLIHHHELSPDGEQVAFVWERDGRSDIFVMPTAGGWPRRLTPNRSKTIYWWDGMPRWSPDGQWLAFAMNGHVQVVPAGGRALPRTVTDFTSAASSPVWMPDSAGLIVSVTRDETTVLLLTDRDGGWPRALAETPGDNLDAAPSPDGRFVVYTHRPLDDLNRWELCLVEVTTGQIRQLTGAPKEKDWSPQWSPNGQQIAFLSQRSGYTEVWVIRPDDEAMQQLTHSNQDVGEFAWSPDGRLLAVTIHRQEYVDLALVEIDSGAIRDVATGIGVFSNLNWSPGGRYLTVEHEAATLPPDLYRVDIPGGQMTQLTFSMPPALAAQPLVTPEHLTYRSFDGLEIPALLWKPANPNGAAIVRPHGGPADQYLSQWDALAQYFLAKGYTFFTPNFRGSSGYGRDFEHANYNDWGVGDTQDILHGAKTLPKRAGWVDPQRIGIFGSSYGGYMVACCLARDPEYLFACGVSKYGDANVYSSWGQCERTTRLYTEMMLGHPRANWPAYLAASPIWEIENVRAPVLLLHGLEDDVVPPQSSEEWAEALRRHDKIFEYKTYAGEPHGFLRYETEMDWQRRTERFFDWYLRA
jgi:dipeptidyl aminopeptidase/acylaminoacyl peptidase